MDNKTDFNSETSGYYSGNNENGLANTHGNDFSNSHFYGTKSYSDHAYSSEEIAARVISRSFIVMFVSLLITAAVSTAVAANWKLFYQVADSFKLLLILELAVVFGASYAVRKKNVVLAGILYAIYTIVNGMTFSVIFYTFDLGSIKEVFVVTALLFGIMALIGITTKIDLSRVGGICTMLLLGGLMVTVLNFLILHSSGLDLLLDYVFVFAFVGLTAYDTQKMKTAARTSTGEDVNLIALFCGMELYLDFINLFLRLLSIMGKRKS